MAVTPIQSTDFKKTHTPYIEATGAVKTTNNIKPARPEGHLVDDSLGSKTKYFFKDIAYDMKALKDGWQGNANDHQSGHLNDVGLKLGGVGIATMLAARTTNPMARLMEYVGLGAFLASMEIFPKLFIYTPSKYVHGFDIGKQYIDEQGRKKSVFQDGNYIPFDMYQGDKPDEDLDIIGDKMGIPREIEDRHDLIKEQMRKIAVQNNTLWMLTAGLATPVMTALICCGLEKVIAPVLEKARNSKYNARINQALSLTGDKMSLDAASIQPNHLSKKVEKILNTYKGREIPQNEIDSLIKIITEELDSASAKAVEKDLSAILKNGKSGEKSFAVADTFADDIISRIQSGIPSRNKAALERVFVPTAPEVQNVLTRAGVKENITEDSLLRVKNEFRNLFYSKIQKEPENIQRILKAQCNNVLESISQKIKENPSKFVNENDIQSIVNFAKIIGDFKEKQQILDRCKSFKVEYAPETVIAKSYNKFEKTLLDVLGIKYKDLSLIRESDKYAAEVFDKKLSELVKDEAKYEKAINKLSKVMEEMEINLNGKSNSDSFMKDLITAIENNYNNTARRLNKIGGFRNTIDALVKEDVSTLSNSLTSREDLFRLLDGTLTDKYKDLTNGGFWSQEFGHNGRIQYVKDNAKGVGSAKNLEISRITDRYQGAMNTFRRIMHMFDVYKRNVPQSEYDKEILAKGKDVLMNATSSDHTLKLDTVNNQRYYRDIMNTIWRDGLEESTSKAMGDSLSETGKVKERLQSYIKRFKDIMGNNDIDFTKPYHTIDGNAPNAYTKASRTRLAKFNLVAQNPAEMMKDAAARRYGNQKWLRIASAIGGTVLGITLLAQFWFGKIKNPQNLKKQVNENANN